VRPAVALVVPCHNYGRYVEEALRSVAAQTRLPDELVVVDDGSSDGTADIVDRVLADLAAVLPRARQVRQDNQGLAGAVERGLAETTAPLVAVVSADDRLAPGFVDGLAAALDAHPLAGFAYPRMRMFGDEHGICRTYPFDVDRLLFDHNYVPGISMMRREAYREAGGLRALPAHEDWDLFLGMAEHGWTGVLVPEVLYEWRRHATARNHLGLRRRLRLRVAVLAGHPRLLARRAHMALPWTAFALGRRVAVRLRPAAAAAVRSESGWVEVGS
jgi:glycosyltransferase involved in cell wall biosynthesis